MSAVQFDQLIVNAAISHGVKDFRESL